MRIDPVPVPILNLPGEPRGIFNRTSPVPVRRVQLPHNRRNLIPRSPIPLHEHHAARNRSSACREGGSNLQLYGGLL